MIKVCKVCYKEFKKKPNYSIKHWVNAKFCSKICYSKFQIGQKPPRSAFKKGCKAPRTAFKKGQFAGDKHYNWKGGITPLYRALRSSVDYEEWRIKVFERDSYTCQFCEKVGGYLNADHIIPIAINPEISLDISNGQTLCYECHRTKTKQDMRDIRINNLQKVRVES